MGEPHNPHFYDFWIFERVYRSQNQLCLSLEAPGYLNKIKKIGKHVLKKWYFRILKTLDIRNFDSFRKDGRRNISTTRLTSWKTGILDQHLSENTKCQFGESLKLWNREPDNLWNQ